MSNKYSFGLSSDDGSRKLPTKIIVGRAETETLIHVGLKLLAFIYFYRDRLQLETRIPDESIPFVPDLVQLDYSLRPVLWVECGECSLGKLHKLAVKAPEAELWLVKRSRADAEETLRGMAKEQMRKGRYRLLALDGPAFEEMAGLIQSRNDLYWLRASADPHEMQFDLNGLWFELPFEIMEY